MRKSLLSLLLLATSCASLSAQDRLYKDEFSLGDVTLLNGPLKHASDVNAKVLLQYDVDRLLAPYRKEAGLPKKAESFPNWIGLDGHVGGHYLTAMAIYAAQGNKQCEERMLYMIKELKACAEACGKNHPTWGKGYIGGIPESDKIWSTFKQGNYSAFNGTWVPLYNIHKMYAGLRDAWVYCGNEDARQLFLGFCDWAIDITSNISDGKLEELLGMEHGGINEVIADAYAITGDMKYLTAAKRFSHKWILNPMKDHDALMLDNKHANTQVPKIVGFARIAELTGDKDYLEASNFFWDEVTTHRSLSIGGNSRREHFPSKNACSDWTRDIDGLESCNTNNMLKLSEDLHRIEPDNAKYADFMERAAFNHVLSTQHPEHGGYVYFTSARPRHYRNYSVPNEAMWCCVGTGMENHGKYGQIIYTHTGTEQLYVNLYTASELNWKENKITLRQETEFPYGETSKITIVKGKKQFAMKLRKPSWCNDFTVMVNGKVVENVKGNENKYIVINRKWKKGDVIEVSFPMHNTIEHMPNVPQYVAILHGPITLGMKTGTEDLAGLLADDSRFGQMASGKSLPIDKAPFLVAKNVEDIADNLVPVEGKPLHYKLNCRMENAIDGELQPFFEIHDSRYMMYWLALSEDGYKGYIDNLAREEADRQKLEARTVDKVQPGEQQPESDHFMETDQSDKGVTNDVAFRDANNGHSFSYLMQTQGKENLALRIRYWGQDEWRTCEYDLYTDDTLVASINNSKKWRSSVWKYETYDIPASALQGKTQVRIKFVAKPHRQVGQIYEVRLLEKEVSATSSKTLVLYYSQEGTTKAVAEELQKRLGADIDSIVVEKPYNGTYDETIQRCMSEMQSNILPKLKDLNVDVAKYDTIYLGYPIWFGTYARPMLAYLKEAKLDGKIIVPFCTFGSGGLNTTSESLKVDQPKATILNGYGVRTARIAAMPKELDRFLKENKYIAPGRFKPYGPYSKQKAVTNAEKKIFDAACSSYQFPLGTPVTVGSRKTKEGIDYMYKVASKGMDGKDATSTIYITVAKGGKPEFTQVLR